MLTNVTIVAFSRHDTLSPLGTYIRHFANCVRDTKYHNQC
jgi:hypothetical protein